MSFNFYIIRHGQTHYNKAQTISESQHEDHTTASFRWNPSLCDSSLTAEGIEQCRNSKAHIHQLPIHKVFVSPLRRALETCKLLFEGHPNSPKIIVFPDLHEILNNGHDVSVFDGRPFDEFSEFDWSLVENDFKSWKFVDNEWKEKLQGQVGMTEVLNLMRENPTISIESVRSVWERAQRTKGVWRREVESGNVAIVTHSTFLREFTKERFEDHGIWLENCECREYRL